MCFFLYEEIIRTTAKSTSFCHIFRISIFLSNALTVKAYSSAHTCETSSLLIKATSQWIMCNTRRSFVKHHLIFLFVYNGYYSFTFKSEMHYLHTRKFYWKLWISFRCFLTDSLTRSACKIIIFSVFISPKFKQ